MGRRLVDVLCCVAPKWHVSSKVGAGNFGGLRRRDFPIDLQIRPTLRR